MEYKEGRIIYTQIIDDVTISIRQSKYGTCVLTIPGECKFGYDLRNKSGEFNSVLTKFIKEHSLLVTGDGYTNRIHVLLKEYYQHIIGYDNHGEACGYFISLNRNIKLDQLI